jgi:hypothetical protein
VDIQPGNLVFSLKGGISVIRCYAEMLYECYKVLSHDSHIFFDAMLDTLAISQRVPSSAHLLMHASSD